MASSIHVYIVVLFYGIIWKQRGGKCSFYKSVTSCTSLISLFAVWCCIQQLCEGQGKAATYPT